MGNGLEEVKKALLDSGMTGSQLSTLYCYLRNAGPDEIDALATVISDIGTDMRLT